MQALNSSGSLQFLYSQSASIREHLIKNPQLIPFFRNKKDIDKDDSQYHEAVLIAELYLNYFENLLGQKNLLNEQDWKNWCRIIDDIFIKSPIVRKQYVEKYKWYTKALHDYVDSSSGIKLDK